MRVSMIVEFIDDDLQEFLIKGNSKKLKKYRHNKGFKEGLERALYLMDTVEAVEELANYSSLHYEALRADYSGYHSVRVLNGSPERIVFRVEENEEGGCIIVITELNTTHYNGKK